jgi:predicted DNA-binding ribbon-helix-helix protein
MSDEKQRHFVTDGKRYGVTLDDTTWTAIDWLAEQRDEKWTHTVRDWLAAEAEKGDDADSNMTRVVRSSAMRDLMTLTIFNKDSEERAQDLALMNAHPIMKNHGILDDQRFDDMLSESLIQGDADFGSFSVLFGYDVNDQPAVWVKNAMRDGLHVVFVQVKADQS